MSKKNKLVKTNSSAFVGSNPNLVQSPTQNIVLPISKPKQAILPTLMNKVLPNNIPKPPSINLRSVLKGRSLGGRGR